jgi:hypothetical protein
MTAEDSAVLIQLVSQLRNLGVSLVFLSGFSVGLSLWLCLRASKGDDIW